MKNEKVKLDCYISKQAKAMLDEYCPAHMTIGETIEMLIGEKYKGYEPPDTRNIEINDELPY